MRRIRLYLWYWFGIDTYKPLYMKREVDFLGKLILDDKDTEFQIGMYSGDIEQKLYASLGFAGTKVLDEQRKKIVMDKIMSGEYYTKD